MKTLLCDRIEEEIAVLHDGQNREIHLPVSLFENGVNEGDVVRLRVLRDEEATLRRKKEIEKRFNSLLKKGEKHEN